MVELEDLFKKGNVVTHGEFFDQRFIDYLDRNFGDISRVHWRQFERIAAEFFEREGFRVQLGPGSNDNGVDVRAWRDDESEAPTVLVQCKRQKDDISKMVVKSLYADVLAEEAESGLIVTTARLEPGAEKVRRARSYPIQTAGRETLKKWIELMRTPFAGTFALD